MSLGTDFLVMAVIKNRRILNSKYIGFRSDNENWTNQVISLISAWTGQLTETTEKIKTEVIVTSDLAPILIFPWQEKIYSQKLQEGIAKHYFDKIFDPAETRTITVTNTGYKKPWIASSLNIEIIHNIQKTLPLIDIVSVIPLSLSVFNHIIRTVKETTFWVVVPESTRHTLFFIQNSALTLVKSIPSSEIAMLNIEKIMQREMRLNSIKEINCSVYSLSDQFDKIHNIKAAWIDTTALPSAHLHLLGAI